MQKNGIFSPSSLLTNPQKETKPPRFKYPLLHLPNLGSRTYGERSRLFFVSEHPHNLTLQIKAKPKLLSLKRINIEKTIENSQSRTIINKMLNISFNKFKIKNEVNLILHPSSKVSHKHLRGIIIPESTHMIKELCNTLNFNTDGSEGTKKIKYESTQGNSKYLYNDLTYPNNPTCSFSNSKYLHTNTELYEVSLWNAFDKLEDRFRHKDAIERNLGVVFKKRNFLYENHKYRKETTQEKILPPVSDFAIRENKELKTRFKYNETKLNKVLERIKNINDGLKIKDEKSFRWINMP